MIKNQIQSLPLSSISIPREARQRSLLSPESVADLAYSIGQNQWISPILVDQDSMTIIAGERRYTAVKLLQDVCEGRASKELAEKLLPVSACHVSSLENWTKIPAQLGSDLTAVDLLVFEFIENKEREDLPWQDRAKAVYEIHSQCIQQSATRWTDVDTAKLLGLDNSGVSRYLRLWREMLRADDKVRHIIEESPTVLSATAAVERVKSRREEHPRIQLGKPAAVANPSPDFTPLPEPDADLEPLSLGEKSIHCADFHEWARDYTGEPFNFLHCDFPYGISFNTGGNFGSAIDTVQAGEYDDSAEVYWDLLNTLLRYKESLIAHSAHLMFWFSQSYPKGETNYRKNMRRQTEDFFLDFFPEAKLQSFPMIWNHSGFQTTPDPQRYGARTYETAMLLTFGDRKTVRPMHLCCEHNPPASAKIHRSQKPLHVLTHFFSMFVDDTTRMLDPTCGSATSLIAAHKLGAESICGLELDPEMATKAIRHFNEATK